MKKIIVVREEYSYKAFLEKNPDKYGRGESAYSAVGCLVLSHRREFDVEIDSFQEDKKIRKK